MNGLEIAVIVGVAIFAGGLLAKWWRVNAALIQLLLGALISVIPVFGDIELPPDLVLLLFLPALLYWESINTSTRELERNARVVVLSAIPLVIATAAAVAALGHAFGLTWPMAIVLGAVLSPTDATAVAALGRSLPRRTLTILRGESLINDGTALTIYGIAVAAAVAGAAIGWGMGALQFVYAYVAAIVIGALIGLLAARIRPKLNNSPLENTASVLTPFIAYLPAELLHASGVVAVVACGLTASRFISPRVRAATYLQGASFWDVTTSLLNGALFVLVGLQATRVFTDVAAGWTRALLLGVLATLVLIVVRFAWVNTTPYLIRAIDRRPRQRAMRVGFRQRLVTCFAGFRGAVSLAAALALPVMTEAGRGLPGRDLIIAATFVTIVLTIVVQGLALPTVIRFARLSHDSNDAVEVRHAQQRMLEAASTALPGVAQRLESPREIREAVERDYDHARHKLEHADDAALLTGSLAPSGYAELRLALLQVKRDTLMDLARRNEIDTTIARQMMQRLSVEAVRLEPATEVE